ncbi:MAG: DUF2285 domain-containing protein [Hyphomonas sp.]|jgi:hypothetical protein|nr:DUF2285 domain-containing protein [Hyphomonas sp.]
MKLHEAGIQQYDYTWKLSRSRWAWEFLRRNPEFLADTARHSADELSTREACRSITIIRPRTDQCDAERWGLAFFPDPSQNGFDANVFWSAGLYPRQVQVQVGPCGPGEHCDIYEKTTSVCRIIHLTDTSGRELLLLKGNGCVVQVRCTGMSLLAMEPVRMRFLIEGGENLEQRYRILKEAHRIYGDDSSHEFAIWSRGGLSLRNALVAFDCHAASLSLRDTAAVIYGKDRADEAWAGPSRSMKDEMRRARARGIELVGGGYRDLLIQSPKIPQAA